MSKDSAGVAVAQPSLIKAAEARREFPAQADAPTFADRAERAVQLASRWAGILAFAGTVAAIIWFVF